MHPGWERQTGEKQSSTFLHLQKTTVLPTVWLHIMEARARTHSGRMQLPVRCRQVWQTGVTSPGGCQPRSPAPGTAGAQPRALVAFIWPEHEREAPGKSLQAPQCQPHPPKNTSHSRHPTKCCQPAEKEVFYKQTWFVFGMSRIAY